MAEIIRNDYEVSSEGAVRHWDVPFGRLEDSTPTPTMPAALLSVVPGTQLTGTILTVDTDNMMAVIDFTHSMVYKHSVRNARTYSSSVEATWGSIAIGDPIYYDRSSTMPEGVYLSTSPKDKSNGNNPLFGFRVPARDDDIQPVGGSTGSTQSIAVMQICGK